MTGINTNYSTPPALITPQTGPDAPVEPVAPEPELELPQGTQAEDVRDAVDATIGPDATVEQRNEAYREVQGYVERAASGGDYEVIDDASMQAISLGVLQRAGLPTVYRPEVMEAVDQALSPDATTGQRLDAYATVDDYVTAVGGISDAGILAEALPGRATQLLHEAGIPTNYGDGIQAGEDISTALDGFGPEDLDSMETRQEIEQILANAPVDDPDFARGLLEALGAEGLQQLLEVNFYAAGRDETGLVAPLQDLISAGSQHRDGARVVEQTVAAIGDELTLQSDPSGISKDPSAVGTNSLSMILGSTGHGPLSTGTLSGLASVLLSEEPAAMLSGISVPLGIDPYGTNESGRLAMHTALLDALAENPEAILEVLRDPDASQNLLIPMGANRPTDLTSFSQSVDGLLSSVTDHVLAKGSFSSALELAVLLDRTAAGGADRHFGGAEDAVSVAIAESIGSLLPVLATGIDPSNRDALARELEGSLALGSLINAGLLPEDASGRDALRLMDTSLTGIAEIVSGSDQARAVLVGAVSAQALILLASTPEVGVADGDASRLSSVTEELRLIMGIFGEGLFEGAISSEAAAAETEKFIESLIAAPLGLSIPGVPAGVATRLAKIPTSAVDQFTKELVGTLVNIEPDLSRSEVMDEIENGIVGAVSDLTYEIVLADDDLRQAIADDAGVDVSEVTRDTLPDLADDRSGPTSSLLRTIQSEFRNAIRDGLADAYIAADAG